MKEFNSGFTEKSYFNLFLKSFEEIYKKNFNLKKLEFNFYINESVNGCADYDKNGEYDLLTINTGTITQIMALVKTAFAQNDILVKFGDATQEPNSIYSGSYQLIDNNHSILFNTTAAIADSIREGLSLYVSLFAIRFIFSHEVGHIGNGHTRLMHSLYADSMISMMEGCKKDNIQYCLDRRTLEMDADAFAATNSIDNILFMFAEQKKILSDIGINSIDELLELWGFAIALVFLVFESVCKTDYGKYELYLPNAARYKSVIGAAKETFLCYKRNSLLLYDLTEAQFDTAIYDGLKEAEQLFRKCGSGVELSKSLDMYRSSYAMAYNEVEYNWENNIRERLKDYSKTVLYDEDETERAIQEMIKKENRFSIYKKIKNLF